jgi:RHS repeat-associated protein
VERGTANGYKIFYDYPDTDYYPNLIRDTDGRQLQLTWKAAPLPGAVGRYPEENYKVIEKIILPDTSELHYSYDAADTVITGAYTSTGNVVTQTTLPGVADRLISVRRKTAAGAVLWGRDYLYQNSRFPYALTGIKDLAGNQINTFSYDAAGQVASSEMAGGVLRHTLQTLVLDANHTASEVTNPLGRTERYVSWRNLGNAHQDSPRILDRIEGSATSTVPADVKRFEYQISGGVILDHTLSATVDRNGVRTDFAVDMGPARRPNAITDGTGRPEQRQSAITYWPNSNLPASITRGTLKTEITYTPTGQVLTQTLTDLGAQTIPYATGGQVRTTSYSWNPNGRIASVNGPLPVNAQVKDDVVSFTYDTSGNLLTATNGLGHVTAFSNYDANGRPQQMTDANSIVTLLGYDPLGRLTSMNVKHPTAAANDAITTFEYDAEGRVTGITRPATDKLIMDYNLAGQLTAIRAASGERMDFVYNAAGGVTAQTVKRADATTARSITRTFDSLNRMLTETLGPGRTTTWAYDKEGNPTQVLSARNNATVMAFDGLNRLVTAALPGGGSEGLGYTAQDDLASHSDALSVTTNFVRNGFGEVIQEVSPDRGTSIYYYDAAARVSAVIDGRGQRIDYARDILGRVTSKTPVGRPASEGVSYVWDTPALTGSYAIGRLSSITDNGTSITRFKYDHRGNLLIKQQAVGSSAAANLSYDYDLADRIVQMTYPSGRLVGYARDTKGRVATVRTKATAATTAWINVATGMTYEPFASLKQATLGNTLSMTNNWGNDGRLGSKRLYVTSSGVNRSLLTYAYDNDDNITGITDGVTANRSLAYTYDARGRLTRSVAQTGTFRREDYLHDANGNRTAVERRTTATTAAAAQTDSYALTPGTNRLASITTSGTATGTRSISYDARGNTASETRPASVSVSTSYDGHGRLISYTRTGEANQANVYNGMDERVTVSSTPSGGATTIRRFVYDPDGRVIGEYGTSATNVIAERIWMTPEIADGGAFGGDDGTGGYAPIALVAGTTLRYVHGNHLGVPAVYTSTTGAAVATPAYTLPGFPGQFRTNTELYYNKYRDYDISTGRYIQADPIGLAGDVNPYLYALGNPVRYTDPTGEFVPLAVLGGMALGALGELAIQAGNNLWNGRDVLDCIEWGEVALAGGMGALGGGWIKGMVKLTPGSMVWRNVSDRIRRAEKMVGGDDRLHHWLVPQRWYGKNGFISEDFGQWAFNRPWNLNPMPRFDHTGLHKLPYILQVPMGAPRAVQAAGGLGAVGAGVEISDGNWE